MTGPWRFNYQDSPETFLKWLLLATVPAEDKELFDDLSVRTKNFTEVELGVTINGTPVDAEKLINFLERSLQYRAEDAADRRLENLGLTLLIDKIEEAQADLIREVKDRLEHEGIRLRRFNGEDEW